jgi:hypothetical protein
MFEFIVYLNETLTGPHGSVTIRTPWTLICTGEVDDNDRVPIHYKKAGGLGAVYGDIAEDQLENLKVAFGV